ncbi:TIGR03984 family CRISPR-associated protein [Pseudanabaena sp. FACHB-1277]|uniref:TIGR03984 family CRISPR-associated protein n=1 Tax=Pseudanabaena cinerea FACHB-1277 TaxID=2949581 RepID=A0A926UTN8_9CYAN|nr:CRISPR-associated protein Csx19 [Pseudanabaena cinerea]MBD2150638.1 TIGR03984 family CRISPR-associated protein [Pseudanabaena cinerea FACHB-1277]
MSTTIVKPNVEHCDPPDFLDNHGLRDWLERQAKKHNLRYLLAHAEDGVIWGRFDDDGLKTSGDVLFDKCTKFHPAKLRSQTLQECRIFSKDGGELHLWRNGGKWRSHFTADDQYKEKIEERQILWGTHGEKNEQYGFTLLRDGSQGLRHAVPFTDIKVDENQKLVKPVRLVVHHYITYDDAGVARISHSRLVDLTTKEKD